MGTITSTDAADLQVDVCAPELARLNLEYVIAPSALVLPCGEVAEQVEFDGMLFSIWQLAPSTG